MPDADKKTKKGKFDAIQEDRRTPIDMAKKEEMLAVLIRNREAYEAVSDLFRVQDCRVGVSEPLGLIWKLVRKFFKDYGELPGKVQLESELHDAVASNSSLLGEDELEEVDEFLTFAWDDKEHGKNIAKSKSHVRVAVATCKRVMEEIVADEMKAKIHKDGTIPVDLPKALAEVQLRVDQVQAITDLDLGLPFPEGWDKRPGLHLTTTGVPAMDVFMGGGWRAGEALLFMAPYGSCKTTLACFSTAELIVECAKMVAGGHVRKNKKGEPMTPVVVLVFTESDKDEYRNRLLSHLAVVPWKRLADMGSIADLDDSSKPGAKEATKYEDKEFAQVKLEKTGKVWRHEQARVARAAKIANRHLILVDCTDSDDTPHRIGSGGMAEVANVVAAVFRKRTDAYPIAVWVDHLSGLADRMTETVKDKDELRTVLTNMPRIAIERMGKKFGCPVGLMHQFAGANQNKGVVARLHHSDAEGSKSIGKYVNFAVMCGTVDENGYCQWQCTKHRREPASATRIIRVDGAFSRLFDASDSHGIEPGKGVIMSKKEMQAAVAFTKATKGGGGSVNDLVDITSD